MGLCSRLLRRPRHRTGSLSMETTRYRADLRQVDTPLTLLSGRRTGGQLTDHNLTITGGQCNNWGEKWAVGSG